METISTYTISRLSHIFAVSGKEEDFLFIDETRYTPSTEEPFRTDTYVVAFLKNGTLGVTVGLNTGIIMGPALLMIKPYSIRSIEKAADNPQLDLLFFKESFFLKNQSDVFSLLKYDFFENDDAHILPLTETDIPRFTSIFHLLKATIQSGHLHRATIVRSYISVLLCEIDAVAQQTTPHSAVAQPLSPLVSHFKTLLSKEVLQQRSVRFYAAQLNVTPKHLSEVIKEQTGKTAGEWIDQTVILEAKVLLQRKELSISQISDLLHFSDQSVFGKFFKVNAGVSPLTYRSTLI